MFDDTFYKLGSFLLLYELMNNIVQYRGSIY